MVKNDLKVQSLCFENGFFIYFQIPVIILVISLFIILFCKKSLIEGRKELNIQIQKKKN